MWKYYEDYSDCKDIDPYKSFIKEVVQYDLNGNFIKKWKSVKDASNQLNILCDSIQAAASQRNYSGGGFMWRYVNNDGTFDLHISPPSTTKKKVNQYDLNGNFLRIWNSIAEAEKTLNIKGGSITKCSQGKWNSAGGYKWEYAKE